MSKTLRVWVKTSDLSEICVPATHSAQREAECKITHLNGHDDDDARKKEKNKRRVANLRLTSRKSECASMCAVVT